MIIESPAQSFRLGLVVLLCAIWLLAMLRFSTYPAEYALLAFAGLGVSAWIAPLRPGGARLAVRSVGTAIGVATLCLLVAVILAIRGGL
jgi:hypothetical protein